MISILLAIFGSLGLFLFGMKVMSEGLQKVSGEGLRALVASMTRNRFAGIVSGTLMTTLVQSSSATTVMMVGCTRVVIRVPTSGRPRPSG